MYQRIAKCDLGNGIVISVSVLCTPNTLKKRVIEMAYLNVVEALGVEWFKGDWTVEGMEE